MAFTNQSIKAILDHDNNTFAYSFYFDNDQVVYITTKDGNKNIDLVELGGEEFVKIYGYTDNLKTGKIDIPTVTYKPTDTLQTILLLANKTDLDKVDIRFATQA